MAEGFEGLEVWQSAHKLRILTHRKIVPRLPKDEKFDLAFQIRKFSKSIGANIAEGYGRFYYQDNVRFCFMARGSLDETIDHLIDARDLDYLDQGLYSEARSLPTRLADYSMGTLPFSGNGKSEQANLAPIAIFGKFAPNTAICPLTTSSNS